MSGRMFGVQVFLETHFAPVLLLLRRLFVGYPYRKIPLTQNKFALVDPEDYTELARHKWCAAKQGNSFYAVRSEGGRQLRMHRVILNAPTGQVVDHMDHDGLNNTKRNLRPCSPAQNAHNQRPQKGRSRSTEVSAGTSASKSGIPASTITAAPARWACSTTSVTPPEPATPPPSPSTANSPSSTSPPNKD
jgi:hypothetical protein